MLAPASAPRFCSQAYAEEALARMKGCHVHIEGVDECVIAFLMSLPADAVHGLVHDWHHDLGFPTVSRLMAIKAVHDKRCARRTASRSSAA